MPWTGDGDELKAALKRAGADFRWDGEDTFYELGHSTEDDLPEGMDARDPDVPSELVIIPVVPVFGGRYVQVIDGARYYVTGQPRDLLELLADVPEVDDAIAAQQHITDVLVAGVEPATIEVVPGTPRLIIPE